MAPPMPIPAGSPFTLQNIPFGVITTKQDPTPRCATAIGAYALDLSKYAQLGHLEGSSSTRSFQDIFSQPFLNEFAALPAEVRRSVRQKIQDDIRENRVEEQCLVPLEHVTMQLPMRIGGYSDFYCSIEHVRNCSPMAADTIPKNWYYAPSVYNSRVSSVIPSGHPVRRPQGVFFRAGSDEEAIYGASEQIDYELEMGYFVSKPVPYGSTLDIAQAKEHIFGFVLLNDWSARDLQVFEMKPLGPFHGKGFGTSISNWVVTMDALEPFSCDPKTKQDPQPYPHLAWKEEGNGALDIKLRVTLIRHGRYYRMAHSNLRYLYWTPYQQLAHHASAGCGLQTGDLMGTGTISGDAADEQGNKLELGCLYEATQANTQIVSLPDGNKMTYLHDGDEVILEAWCGGDDDTDGKDMTLGFGECRAMIVAAAGTR